MIRDSLLARLGLQCGRPFRLASFPHRFLRVPGQVCNTLLQYFRLLAGGPGLGNLWPCCVFGSASAGQGGVGFGLTVHDTVDRLAWVTLDGVVIRSWLGLAQVTGVSGLLAAD